MIANTRKNTRDQSTLTCLLWLGSPIPAASTSAIPPTRRAANLTFHSRAKKAGHLPARVISRPFTALLLYLYRFFVDLNLGKGL